MALQVGDRVRTSDRHEGPVTYIIGSKVFIKVGDNLRAAQLSEVTKIGDDPPDISPGPHHARHS